MTAFDTPPRTNKTSQGRKRLPLDQKRILLVMRVLPATMALYKRHGRRARAIAEAAMIYALTMEP